MSLTRAGVVALKELRKVSQSPGSGVQLELPWGGRSPRTLTQAFQRFSLQHEAARLEELDDEIIEEQCRRHLYGS